MNAETNETLFSSKTVVVIDGGLLVGVALGAAAVYTFRAVRHVCRLIAEKRASRVSSVSDVILEFLENDEQTEAPEEETLDVPIPGIEEYISGTVDDEESDESLDEFVADELGKLHQRFIDEELNTEEKRQIKWEEFINQSDDEEPWGLPTDVFDYLRTTPINKDTDRLYPVERMFLYTGGTEPALVTSEEVCIAIGSEVADYIGENQDKFGTYDRNPDTMLIRNREYGRDYYVKSVPAAFKGGTCLETDLM